MYRKALLLIDEHATVGGVAAAYGDLSAIGARTVDIERLTAPVLELPLATIAEKGRTAAADVVALGVADAASLRDVGVSVRTATNESPLLYLGVTVPEGPLLPARGRILNHVLVPGDFSVKSACVSACLDRIARRGARVVTLLHMPDPALTTGCNPSAAGELSRIDTDWVDQVKRRLFSAGVYEVRFVAPEPDARQTEFEGFAPPVSLILAGRTCGVDIARAYSLAASRLMNHREEPPALMLTADTCSAASGRLGAA